MTIRPEENLREIPAARLPRKIHQFVPSLQLASLQTSGLAKFFERKPRPLRIAQCAWTMNLESDLIEQELVIKRQIWIKFERRMKAWLREQAVNNSLRLESLEMKPDVIVIARQETVRFEPQTPQAAAWLRQRCRLTSENPGGHTEFLVHPLRGKEIVEDLKAAGFAVANGRRFITHYAPPYPKL